MKSQLRIRAMLFGGLMLGLTGFAMAHHGNPQAPAPAERGWQSSLPTGTPAPQSPAFPGS